MKSVFFFWASEAPSILWVAPEGLPLVAAHTPFMGESPFPFTEDINKECETDKRGKSVAVQPLWEQVLFRKCQELAC